ncbi:MAG: helix-turn-helix transcriptional regulator [Lewinellaceae bacterium]|nr:helix-turn-helix transcriptional regulator [Lewinellaceae bacterium]
MALCLPCLQGRASRQAGRRTLCPKNVQQYEVRALTDKSPSLFVRSIRLQKAKALLLSTNLNISEIAYDVGFNDPAFFSRTFREEFGLSPTEVRERQ